MDGSGGGGHAEQALDASDDTADRSADDGTNRACNAEALIGTIDEPSGDALSLGRERRGDRANDDGCVQHLRFHGKTP